jgi:hypothetical protein
MLDDTRKGKFSIQLEIIHENPEIVRQIMGECIVIKAETDLFSESIDYQAYCDGFLPVEAGEVVPEYDVGVADDGTIVWTKM